MGIRVTASSISYSTNDAVSWSGQGILSQSITNFAVNTAGEYYYNYIFGPYFPAAGALGAPSFSGFRVMVSSTLAALIPEPEEYAIVFGLFALGFIFFHRHITRKNGKPSEFRIRILQRGRFCDWIELFSRRSYG